MRVGCRRLRSDLRTFGAAARPRLGRPACAPSSAGSPTRSARPATPRCCASAAAPHRRRRSGGAARPGRRRPDRRRPRRPARGRAAGAGRGDARRRATTRCSTRCVDAAREPQLTRRRRRAGRRVLPRLVARPWRRLAYGGDGVVGAGRPRPARARRALARGAHQRASGPGTRSRRSPSVLGGEAAALAKALAEVQELLGEHQDAAIAADTWLAIADVRSGRPRARGDRRPAVRAGAGRVRAVRAPRSPTAWRRAAERRRRTAWLPVTPVRAAGGVVWRPAGRRRPRDLPGAPAALRRLVAAQGQARRGRAPARRRGARGPRGDRRTGRAAGAPARRQLRLARRHAEDRRLLVDALRVRRRTRSDRRGRRRCAGSRRPTRRGC